MNNVETDREGVKRALERLLAWPDIARSPQLANFLRYIVDRRLSGDAQSIKAYSIAVDVFGRSPDFDPQADPIVRVQARRLRGLLDQYYRGPGADEPLRIELPIGRYVPEFIDSATEPSARPIGAESVAAPEAPPAGYRIRSSRLSAIGTGRSTSIVRVPAAESSYRPSANAYAARLAGRSRATIQ